MENSEDYTPQEKAALIVFQLAEGRSFSTREVADQFGISYHNAYMTLTRLSRVVPITHDGERNGRWYRF